MHGLHGPSATINLLAGWLAGWHSTAQHSRLDDHWVGPLGCAGDYETRSLGVVKPGGAFVSILNSGWLKYYGQGGAIARTLWGLAKG